MSESPQAGAAASSRIDWAAIHRRLDHARLALERGVRPSAQDKARTLARRAQALASAPAMLRERGPAVEELEFLLAHERYAVAASLVSEVSPLREITALPGVPPFVLGIINVRGQIVSVIDLRRFFELPRPGLTDLNKVIILSDGAMRFGVLADAVLGVERLSLADIQPPPQTLGAVRAEYLSGVTAHGLIVLDAAKILADPRLVVRADGAG